MSIDFSNEANKQMLGKSLTIFDGEWDHRASIVYVDGIQFFDDELNGHKFEETDCRLSFEIFETAMVFILTTKHGNPLRYFGIWNKDMLSMEMIKNVPIKVPKFSRWKEVLPWAPVGGGIGYAIASYRKDKAARKQEFSVIGSQEVKGWIMKLLYTDDQNGSKKTITFNILIDYHHEILEALFERCWSTAKNY